MTEPTFTIGIEEEYLLVDLRTRDLVSEPPASLFKSLEARLQGQVSREFLRPQVEVGTSVCRSVAEARGDLKRLRRAVTTVAQAHGMAPIAASTHPFADWKEQKHTEKARYQMLSRNMQAVGSRLLIGGMHVHVGIEDDDLRIDILNQVSYFLPHLLALSTSSPFWEGRDTGLKSYRLTIFDALPRTGMPDPFVSYGEFERAIAMMVKAGLLAGGTEIWWDVRPSVKFPTLEMRITDVCPLIEDAICCAALFQCLCRMLYRLRLDNQRWRFYSRMLIHENRWRAQRYGLDEGMVDFGRGETVPFADLMEELLEILQQDAVALECLGEIGHVRTILRRGTSAHDQVAVFRACRDEGMSRAEALQEVVGELIRQTQAGL